MLTVLGAVGIGALLMSMKEENTNVKEDFVMAHINTRMEKVSNSDGVINAPNFTVQPQYQASVKQAAMLQKQGVPQSQIMSTLSNSNMQTRQQQLSTLNNMAMAPNVKENYNSSSSLGSSAVTRNDYVSYPNFNQTIPLQSPSLNLGRDIRYNPPSLDKMGVTEAYQSRVEKPLSHVMDYSNIVKEGFDPNFSTLPPQASMLSTGLPPPAFTANGKSFDNARAQGNKGSDKFIDGASLLPLGDMSSSSGQNVVMFDRPIYAGTRTGGWRAGGKGDSDLIRGDLAVCVDPCQKGWFQSSLKPSDLRLGALQQIAGTSEQGSTVGAMAATYGQISPQALSATQQPQYTPNQMALLQTPSGTVFQTTSFA